MIVEATVTTDKFYTYYVMLWNGYFNLTQKETRVIIFIVKNRQIIDKECVRLIKQKFRLSDQGWYNMRKSLERKKAINKKNLNPRLIPREEITFKFNVNEVDEHNEGVQEPVAEEDEQVAETSGSPSG